jgi:nitrite reductase/ring-hydroxylating ferredoxin subunit
MPYTRLAPAADIADNKSLAVTHNGQNLLICHSGGIYYTVANRCSHAAEPLECGRIRHGWIACPVHGARFDLETGEALNPPAKDPIPTYPTQITDGWVEADLP